MATVLEFDTLIIGGGLAGLQAAIQLGRSLHHVAVADNGSGRSSIAKNYRNILGYPDGVSGQQLRSLGEQQARQFGVSFFSGTVTSLTQNEDGRFRAELTGLDQEPTAFLAKTILLSSGIKDPFPTIQGLDPCLGESIFICPDCDGYEIVNQHALVIGSGSHAVQMAKTLRYFTKTITIVNHDGAKVEEPEQAYLVQEAIPIHHEPIVRIEQEGGRLKRVELASGTVIAVEKGFLAFPGAKLQTSLLAGFDLQRLDTGHILANPRTKETTCRNIWAAGDVVAHSQQVTISLGDGSQAAIWIHKRLLEMAKGNG
ncbi:NAD(P)/FAD-dependent oxidoreductase [Brevibacillus fluminis]|uniref:NAD(P)/FAD-dependent oxidoreductase n=1 Tax=Brevibacillus fluminis TaxID=511487 RepID=UPI003F892BCA